MGTAAWVCFDCRTVVRRDTWYAAEVPCAICRKPCTYLGYKIPVPPKIRGSEWEALREQLFQERVRREVAADGAAVRNRHALEQKIARLEALPFNDGRQREIDLLKRRLASFSA